MSKSTCNLSSSATAAQDHPPPLDVNVDENNNPIVTATFTTIASPSDPNPISISSTFQAEPIHLDTSLNSPLRISSSCHALPCPVIPTGLSLSIHRPVQFVCSSSAKSPIAFCISNGRLCEYQANSTTALSFEHKPNSFKKRHFAKVRQKLKSLAAAYASPLDLLRVSMYIYLVIDILLNVLLLFHLSQLNSLFMARLRNTIGMNPLDCSSEQAQMLLLAILLSAVALDALGLFAVASQDLWLSLLNVCQISINLLKVCFLFDSLFVFLVHLLFVFVAAIHTALLLPTDIFP